jgi:hypothetical protein
MPVLSPNTQECGQYGCRQCAVPANRRANMSCDPPSSRSGRTSDTGGPSNGRAAIQAGACLKSILETALLRRRAVVPGSIGIDGIRI